VTAAPTGSSPESGGAAPLRYCPAPGPRCARPAHQPAGLACVSGPASGCAGARPAIASAPRPVARARSRAFAASAGAELTLRKELAAPSWQQSARERSAAGVGVHPPSCTRVASETFPEMRQRSSDSHWAALTFKRREGRLVTRQGRTPTHQKAHSALSQVWRKVPGSRRFSEAQHSRARRQGSNDSRRKLQRDSLRELPSKANGTSWGARDSRTSRGRENL
jgi:hypothetical protein